MDKWTESELNWYLERLASDDTWNLASALSNVAQIGREPKPQPTPTGNAQVIARLEELVEDERWCVVDHRTPYTYGEMRWLAARLLACEYAYQGIETPIILKDVIQPVREDKYGSQYYRTILERLIQQDSLPG